MLDNQIQVHKDRYSKEEIKEYISIMEKTVEYMRKYGPIILDGEDLDEPIIFTYEETREFVFMLNYLLN